MDKFFVNVDFEGNFLTVLVLEYKKNEYQRLKRLLCDLTLSNKHELCIQDKPGCFGIDLKCRAEKTLITDDEIGKWYSDYQGLVKKMSVGLLSTWKGPVESINYVIHVERAKALGYFNRQREQEKEFISWLDFIHIEKIQNHARYFFYKVCLYELIESAMNIEVDHQYESPSLDNDDRRLVDCWRQDIKDGQADEDGRRLLSARSAEKVAVSFYRSYCKTVEDISITQVRHDDNEQKWCSHDLLVDGAKVDVKNTRSSGAGWFSGFKIQNKYERADYRDTCILGVLSPLRSNDGGDGNNTIQVLGETSPAARHALEEVFGDDKDIINISGFFGGMGYREFRGRSFSPWLLDYPGYVYRVRDERLQALRDFYTSHKLELAPVLREAMDSLEYGRNGTEIMSACLASGIMSDLLKQHPDLNKSWTGDFLTILAKRISQHGLSMPVLFLTLLIHFLRMVRKPGAGFRPVDYERYLFYEPDRYDNPLGIHDPLVIISLLLNVLQTLWDSPDSDLGGFTSFELRSGAVLRGRCGNEDDWTTLLAYCGECKNSPLVLGENDTCDKCGKLICEARERDGGVSLCFYCDPGCNSLREKRRQDYVYKYSSRK